MKLGKKHEIKLSKAHTIIAAVIFVFLSLGLIIGEGFGTLSGFGWQQISALCPLGAFMGMVASKTFIPRGIISIIFMIILILILGRAFCGYMCPVPLLTKLREFFAAPMKRQELVTKKTSEMLAISKHEIAGEHCDKSCNSCSVCALKGRQRVFDSRHYILGGTLLSTLIFGFPVFCVICPIGLSFATVLLIFRAFSSGDASIGILVAPLIIVIELVVLKKWCNHICPLSAFMSLVGRFSKTTHPVIDNTKCIETSEGKPCNMCAISCNEGIDLRHLDFGEFGLENCTRCNNCVDHCPTHAISMPLFVSKKNNSGQAINLKSTTEQV